MSSSISSFAQKIGDSEHWLPAADLLDWIEVHPGFTVGEIGAGTGYYTLPVARGAGPAGAVFAVEWRPWVMDELRARLSGPDALENVHLKVGRPGETHLAAESCDLVILADIWHELEHPDAALDEVRRILRPGGRLAILNWRPDGLCPPGPPVEHRVSMRRTVCAVEMKSWTVIKAADIGLEGYLLVFEVTDESVQS